MASIHDAAGTAGSGERHAVGTDASGRWAAWGVAALTVVTVLVGSLAPRPATHAAAVAPEADAACLEWTDGCRVCRRLAEGPACSLPGIACTPGASHCLHRADG